MKNSAIFTLFLATLFAFSSCSSDQNQQTKLSSSISDTKKETRGVAAAESFGNKFSSVDNSYIILKVDGSFEASLEDNEIIKGNYVEDRDAKKLTLNTEKSGDGKGKSYVREFSILLHSEDELRLIDSKGKEIIMKSEE